MDSRRDTRAAGRRVGLALVALALVMAGCARPEPVDADALVVAADTTEQAGTAHMAATMELSVFGEDVVMEFDGVLDFVGERGHMVMSMTGLAAMGAPGPLSGEMITIGDDTWLSGAAYQGGQIDEGVWVRVDTSSFSPLSGLEGPTNPDPEGALALLRDLGGDVVAAGSEPVRGVDTVRYDATLDARGLFEEADETDALPAELRERFSDVTVQVSVWVDGDDLVRRHHTVMDYGEVFADLPGGDDGFTMTMTFELYDFGVPVDIAPPPDDAVIDADEVAAPFAAEPFEPDEDVAPPPALLGLPVEFPSAFPLHPAAGVIDAHSSGPGLGSHEATLWVGTAAGGQAAFDDVEAFYRDALPEAGWRITADHQSTPADGDDPPRRTTFEIEGNGYTGSITIDYDTASFEVTIDVTLRPAD